MPKPIRDLVIPDSKEPGERVAWSVVHQAAYVVPLKFDDGAHITVFADSLSDKQRTYLEKQKWAPLDELEIAGKAGVPEALGKALMFSEFHVTIQDMHFYYTIAGYRIYKTNKLSSERTAMQMDNWTAADIKASTFLENINLDVPKGPVYDPQGTLVYQRQ